MAKTLTFAGLVAAMNHIRASGAEWPHVSAVLREDFTISLVLSRDGKAVIAKLPGAAHTKLAFMRADSVTWTPAARYLRNDDKAAFWELSKALARDPIGTLAEQGKRLGWCAICLHPLSNDESMNRGIGPDCWARLNHH